MPKGVTKLLSDGAAKRVDPGVAMPKKSAGNKAKVIDKSRDTIGRPRFDSDEGGRDVYTPRSLPFRAGLDHPDKAERVKSITRPNAANSRARAAGSLLSRMMPPKKK